MSLPAPPDGEPPGPAADPSMEDILASIRRILNDGDGEPAEAEAPPSTAQITPGHLAFATQDDAPAPPAPASAGAAPALPLDDGVFLLDRTMLIEEPAPMPEPAATSLPHEEPPRAAQPEPDYSHLDAGEPPPGLPDEPLLSASTAAAATASLGALVRVVGQRSTQVYRGGPTLEDMVRDEIRPLVKSWLDENLAPMVERLVRTEIERVARNG